MKVGFALRSVEIHPCFLFLSFLTAECVIKHIFGVVLVLHVVHNMLSANCRFNPTKGSLDKCKD